MKLRKFLPLSVLLLGAAAPCIWDYDTLAVERSRFPTAHELITGRFPRHSEAFYQWRITDREQRLRDGDASPEVYDDLAVSYSKLGQDERAIELMGEKEALHPGLYQTAANLGTFHIHAGHLEKGVDEIVRAIKINPDAHFGREIYQELLVRYVLQQRALEDSPALPLQLAPISRINKTALGFWSYLGEQRHVTKGGELEELSRALRGVTGMLRFGNHDSPVLLEVLSDLLLADQFKDAKRLAARALLKASYEVADEDQRAAYRAKAEAALLTQTPTPSTPRNMTLEQLEATLAVELKDAEQWTAEIAAREAFWIEQGADVDARFADVYLTTQSNAPDEGRARYSVVDKYGKYVAILLLIIGVGCLISLARR